MGSQLDRVCGLCRSHNVVVLLGSFRREGRIHCETSFMRSWTPPSRIHRKHACPWAVARQCVGVQVSPGTAPASAILMDSNHLGSMLSTDVTWCMGYLS